MTKILVFDMDGTIADLYAVNNWLPKLRSEDATPYMDAAPMYDMETLNNLLHILKLTGWKIVVTTWLSKGSTKEYDAKVRAAKKAWLDKYRFPYDELHMIQYGTTKANCTRRHGGYQILVDDNGQIRNGWHLGKTIDANNNILHELEKLIAET